MVNMQEDSSRGPTARQVAANVRQVRQQQGLDLVTLAERVTKAGRRMSFGQLSKIELGNRRVDVDDLVALAVALNVSPGRLLLPQTELTGQSVDLTPAVTVPWAYAWEWASGEWPLRRDPYPEDDEFADWVAENHPHDDPFVFSPSELTGHEEDMRQVIAAIRAAVANGLTTQWVTKAFRFFTRMDPSWEG